MQIQNKILYVQNIPSDKEWLDLVKGFKILEVYFDVSNGLTVDKIHQAMRVHTLFRSVRGCIEPVVLGGVRDEDRGILEENSHSLRSTSYSFNDYCKEMQEIYDD